MKCIWGICINLSFIVFTELFNSPTTILNHFILGGAFSVPFKVHTAGSIAQGQIHKEAQGWLWGCRKTHVPLPLMQIQKERKPRKKLTSKQARQCQLPVQVKGRVISADSDLSGILWRVLVCFAGFSHLPLETECEWTFFPSSKKKKIKKEKE